MTELQLTNAEKSAQLNSKAQKTLLSEISKDWKDFEEAAQRIKSRTIFAVNKLRSIGLKIQQVSGHEQIDMAFYVSIRDQLPKSFRFIDARCAVHISHGLKDGPAKTFQEAADAHRQLYLALGDYKEPKRLEAQTAHERNPISDFVNWCAGFNSMFKEYDDSPPESWSREKLRTFVDATKPIAEKHHQAAAILLEEAR